MDDGEQAYKEKGQLKQLLYIHLAVGKGGHHYSKGIMG